MSNDDIHIHLTHREGAPFVRKPDDFMVPNDEIPLEQWGRDRLLYTLGLWAVPINFTTSTEDLQAAVRTYEAQRLAGAAERPDMEVQRVLVLSTAHLHVEDAHKLNRGEGVAQSEDPIDVSAPFDCIAYGWVTWIGTWIDVSEDGHPRTDECEQWVTNLALLAREAEARGCTYIRFDQDGETYDHLPAFEW